MAESNQHRYDPSTELDEDDPMLELARIMGPQSFDKAAARPVEEDFGIDLEQEMLGEFSEPARAEPAAQERSVETEAAGFDSAAAWQPAEQDAGSVSGPDDAPAEDELEIPDMEFEAFSGGDAEPEAASVSTGTGDPLLDEMFSLDNRDALPGDAAGYADEDEPVLAEEAVSREIIEEDEDQLAADLAALERAFTEHDVAETGASQEWQEQPGGRAEDEAFAGDDLETTAFNDIKASLAGIGETPDLTDDSTYRGHQDDRAEAQENVAFAGDEALRQNAEHDWDTYDERADFDGSFEPAPDAGPELSFEAAKPDTGHWAGTGADLAEPVADEQLEADGADDIPEFDEDAFLDQSFLDDELFAELDLEDSAPEERAAPADDRWQGFSAGDDFDRGIDLDPAAYEMDDAGRASSATGESDDELAVAIEDTFDVRDDGAIPAAYTATASAYDIPEIETTEIDDAVVPVTGDLDVPEFEPEVAAHAADPFGDFETGYEEAPESDSAADSAAPDKSGDAHDFESYFAEEFSQMGFDLGERQKDTGGQFSEEAALAAVMRATHEIGHGATNGGAYAHAADTGQEDDEPAKGRNRQGLIIAAAVAGIAILGAVGAFTLTSGGTDTGGEPAIVRADPDPVKVKPADPGGTQVPNTDKKVYERVAGAQTDTDPEQKTLVTTGEEPIDVARTPAGEAPAGSEAPVGAPKSEDRVDPSMADSDVQADEDIIAVAPRRVKTFVVQPDGTLVQRESPASTEAAAEQPSAVEPQAVARDSGIPVPQARPAAAASDTPAADSTNVATAAPQPATPKPETPVAKVEPQVVAEDTRPEPVVAPVPVKTTTISAPAVPTTAPVVASRPANQPVNIVGRTGTTNQPASTAPAAADTTAGESNTSPAWVQISSHASRDLAQVSYHNDVKRYGSLITGRGVNIVAADVRGQIWYRVNIPAQSWSDAANLCQRIKAAGGDCLPKR